VGKCIFKLSASTGSTSSSVSLPWNDGLGCAVDTTDDSIYIGTTGRFSSCLIKYNSSFEEQWKFDFWRFLNDCRGITFWEDFIFCTCDQGGGFKLAKDTGELLTWYNIDDSTKKFT